MLKLAFDGIASFSFLPLRLATWLGFAAAGASALGIVITLYMRFFTQLTIQGWSSMLLVTLFLGSIQLLSLGIIGEYLGRMFDEVRQRPLYLVTSTKGLQEPKGQRKAA